MRGEVAVVTGAGGGLGTRLAQRFAAGGAAVACLDRDAAAAAQVAGRVTADGGSAMAVGVDIADEAAVAAARETVAATAGAPSILVNAAGLFRRERMEETGSAGFRSILDVNLVGTYLVTRAFAADLAAGGWGRIINIASIAGTTGYPYVAYGASKAGVISLTRSLVFEFWGSGVTVNAICPGAMATPMMDRSRIAEFERKTPVGRVVTPDEVAQLCVFLSSDAAACINGQAIVVDGGATTGFSYSDVIGGT